MLQQRNSPISITDKRLFRKLANPEEVDFSVPPSVHQPPGYATVESVRAPVYSPDLGDVEEDAGSLFAQYVQAELARSPLSPPETLHQANRLNSPQPFQSPTAFPFGPNLSPTSTREPAYPTTLMYQDAFPVGAPSPDDFGDFGDDDFSTADTPVNQNPPDLYSRHIPTIPLDENDPDIRIEKRQYLIDLAKYKRQGVVLTREYTMTDKLEDIKFEYDCHTLNFDMIDKREFLKSMLKYLSWGIEGMNTMWGPFIHLQGWASDLTADMTKFNLCLERIIKTYWRRSSMSPIVEFMWLFFGSMVMWHLRSKCGPVVDMVTGMFSGMTPGNKQPGSAIPQFHTAMGAGQGPAAQGDPNPYGVPSTGPKAPMVQVGVPFEIPDTPKRAKLGKPGNGNVSLTPNTVASWIPTEV